MTIQCTKEHPFFVYGKGWVQAEMLECGDSCRTASDKTMVLRNVEVVPGEVKVYNFQVKNAHTYFVGETDEESVLVHNACDVHVVYFHACRACQENLIKGLDFQTAPLSVNTATPESVSIFESGNSFTTSYSTGSFEDFIRTQGTKAAVKIVGDGGDHSVPSYGAVGPKFKLYNFNLGSGKVVIGGNVKVENLDEIGKLALRKPLSIFEIVPELPGPKLLTRVKIGLVIRGWSQSPKASATAASKPVSILHEKSENMVNLELVEE